ncbi:hypothetical protein QP938_04390 [Porticoccaceae bacterium LTM1]|nr:hypothetical protein QP938_04390 [Porticoccaceae bacterium LTM1]
MKKISLTLAIAAALASTGCASIVSDSSYPVAISSNPSGAQFTITDKSGRTVHSGTTPNTVILESGAGFFSGEDYTITYNKEGYGKQTARLKAGIDGWYFGNLLIGGLIGMLIVDPATGAMYKLPNTVTTTLTDNAQANGDAVSLKIITVDQLSTADREQLQAIN